MLPDIANGLPHTRRKMMSNETNENVTTTDGLPKAQLSALRAALDSVGVAVGDITVPHRLTWKEDRRSDEQIDYSDLDELDREMARRVVARAAGPTFSGKIIFHTYDVEGTFVEQLVVTCVPGKMDGFRSASSMVAATE
jgi:hypothetical protein